MEILCVPHTLLSYDPRDFADWENSICCIGILDFLTAEISYEDIMEYESNTYYNKAEPEIHDIAEVFSDHYYRIPEPDPRAP
jgi:hypothetical protein